MLGSRYHVLDVGRADWFLHYGHGIDKRDLVVEVRPHADIGVDPAGIAAECDW